MKNTIKQKIKIISIATFFIAFVDAADIRYDKDANTIELTQEIIVTDNVTSCPDLSRHISVFTPPAPFNNATFVINIPALISVDVPFIVDYAIKVKKFVNIPFWSDLLPDSTRELTNGLRFMSYEGPTIGIFDLNAESFAKKGGKGSWIFPKGLCAHAVHHLRVRLKATSVGVKQYTTVLATNPPLFLGPIMTNACGNYPIANADNAATDQKTPVIIAVLDNDSSSSALHVVAITKPKYGNAFINSDNTLTYIPNEEFVGSDELTYTVQDEAGKNATGLVTICVARYQKPAIVL